MYFLRIGKLTQDLKEDKVSQVDAVKYFIGLIVIASVFGLISQGGYVLNSDFINILEGLVLKFVDLLLFVFGVVIAYLANKSGDNKNFLLRFVSLSFVADIYRFLFVILFLTAFDTLLLLGGIQPDLYLKIINVFLGLLFQVFLYIVIRFKMKYISQS